MINTQSVALSDLGAENKGVDGGEEVRHHWSVALKLRPAWESTRDTRIGD